MKYILLLILTVSCALPNRESKSRVDRNQDAYKQCVKDLFNEGIKEHAAYYICQDIYRNG